MKIGRAPGPRNSPTTAPPARDTGGRPRAAAPRVDATPAAVKLDPTPPAQAAAPSCAPRRSAAPARAPGPHASARQRGPEGIAAQRPPGARAPAAAPSGPSEALGASRTTGRAAGAREGASRPYRGGAGYPAGGAPSRGGPKPHAVSTGEGARRGHAVGDEEHATGNRARSCAPIVLILKPYLPGNCPEPPADRAPEAAAAPATPERRPPRNPELAAAQQEDPQLGRLNYQKRYAVALAEQLDAAGRPKLAARVHRCSDTLCLDERGKVMHRQACRVRVCPICQAFRASRWAGDLRAGLIAMQATEPDLEFAHLTLTVRNCAVDELRERTSAIHDALDRMTKRAVFPALGYVRNTEVTVNLETREVHPHVHMLLALPASYYAGRWHYAPSTRKGGRRRIVPGYMEHAEYVELWRGCAKLDYAPSVRIQAVDMDSPEGRQSLYEVAKYGVKPASVSGMPPEMLGTFLTQIHKRRAIAVTGIINRYVREPDEGEEPDERNAEASATWEPGARRYVAASLREVAE